MSEHQEMSEQRGTVMVLPAGADVSEVFDGDFIGRIIFRGGAFFPEPAKTEWAQDELSFSTQAEAVAFLQGAAWIGEQEMSDEAQRAAEDVFWRRVNIRADTPLKSQLRWEPWKVVIASAVRWSLATATAMGFVR